MGKRRKSNGRGRRFEEVAKSFSSTSIARCGCSDAVIAPVNTNGKRHDVSSHAVVDMDVVTYYAAIPRPIFYFTTRTKAL